MTDGQIYTPPVGELVRSIVTIRRWAVQFQETNWGEVADFLRFFGINWCMRLCGDGADTPELLDVQDEDGLFHQVLPGDWITVDDGEERYVGIFSDRYFAAHYTPAS